MLTLYKHNGLKHSLVKEFLQGVEKKGSGTLWGPLKQRGTQRTSMMKGPHGHQLSQQLHVVTNIKRSTRGISVQTPNKICTCILNIYSYSFQIVEQASISRLSTVENKKTIISDECSQSVTGMEKESLKGRIVGEEVFPTLLSAMSIKVGFSLHDGLSLALHNFRI